MAVSGTVSPTEINFETNGYSLSGGSVSLPYSSSTVRVDAASATIASPITSGSLSKSGSGVLTLTGSSGFGGDTNVLAGTLTVNGSLATSGNVIVQSGAILTGVGTVGTVYVYAGGTLATGTNGSGTLTTSSVELFADDLLDYTLGTGIPGLDGLVSCSDTVGLVGGVIVNVTAGVNWGNGMFPLFNLLSFNLPAPVTFDAGSTILGANLGGHIYDLVATGNYLDLNVQAVAGVWSAAGGGAYGWGTAGNWQGGVAPNAVGDTAVLGTVVGGARRRSR